MKNKVIPDVKSTTIVEFAKSAIDKGTTIVCDAYHWYRNLHNKGFQLEVQKFDVKSVLSI